MQRYVRTTFAAVIALSLGAGGASADGMPRVQRYSPERVQTWSGFYLGAGVGYSSFQVENDNLTLNAVTGALIVPVADVGGKGALGTVIVGYDHQFGTIVAGVFADYDWSSASGTMLDVAFTPAATLVNGKLEQDNAWALGGRLGVLVSPGTLIYATGGWTKAGFDHVEQTSLTGTALRIIPSAKMSGGFIGAGVETKLWQSTSFRLEYRYSDIGDQDYLRVNPVNGVTTPGSYDASTQSVRAVLTYKFGQ